jgi:hypothetical protein
MDANRDSILNLFVRTKEAYAAPDLFNNAGIGAPGVVEDSRRAMEAVVDTNLTGSFICTQEAFDHEGLGIAGRRITTVDSGPCAPAQLVAHTPTVAMTAPPSPPRSTAEVRHRVRPDRHRQRADAPAERMAGRAPGQRHGGA